MADTPAKINRLPLALNTALRVLAVFALCAVANGLSFRYYGRLDVSRASVPPLTERTKAFLLGMPREARIIVFFNPGNPIFEQVNLLALQYSTGSRKISLETVNPYRDQDRAAQVAQHFKTGERENAIIVTSGDRHRLVALDELADFDRTPEAFGQPARATNFKGEAAVTGALIEVTERNPGTVYFLRGQGQPLLGPKAPFLIFATLLEREGIKVKELALGSTGRVPADAAVVVSLGAKYDSSDDEFKALRDYWDRNGKIFLLLDPNASTPRQLAWLGSLGVMVQDDRLYAHPPSGLVSTVAAEFAGGSSIAQKFRTVTPFLAGGTQSLKLEPARVAPAQIRVEPLLQAVNGYWGEADWRMSGVNGVDYDPDRDRTGDLVVAALVERGEPDAVDLGRLFVVSNAKYILDDNLTQPCADFSLAAVNWLLRREALTGIPPRELKLFNLAIPETQLARIFLLVVVAMPALAGLTGLALWWRRRS